MKHCLQPHAARHAKIKGREAMSPAPFQITALPFLLAYEVSCRTRTGSVRRERRSAISPCFLRNVGSPVLLSHVRHEQLRQTSKFSTLEMLLLQPAGGNTQINHQRERSDDVPDPSLPGAALRVSPEPYHLHQKRCTSTSRKPGSLHSNQSKHAATFRFHSE